MATRRASRRFAAGIAVAAAVAGGLVVWGPWRSEGPAEPEPLTAPIAAGTSAANVPLSGNEKWVLVRWVARRTGTLAALHLRVQADGSSCRKSGKSEYGDGDGGAWYVTTHPVLGDGRPDLGHTLARQEFRPCAGPRAIVDPRQGVVRLPMRLHVERGAEYATVVHNDDPQASTNYTSVNFLFMVTGLLGANARNERSAAAPDAYYGLDPRELVGYSADGGRTWQLPGGPYGTPPLHRNFLPTYLQAYDGGPVVGQPYYYTGPYSKADRTMTFQSRGGDWTIRGLGVFIAYPSEGTLTLTVEGRRRARVRVAGKGLRRVPIAPVSVPVGRTATVTASGLWIRNIVADTVWGRLMRLDKPDAPWRLEDSDNFSAAAPVYPLPAPPG